jgi:hypothetical protein
MERGKEGEGRREREGGRGKEGEGRREREGGRREKSY